MSISKKVHIVVAGQFPPPIGGQNINIKRIFDLLSSQKDMEVSHLKFEFTKSWRTNRKVGGDKVVELFRVFVRLLCIRKKGGIDFLLYPVGGPHTVPLIRDWILLPILSLFSKRIAVHFQAAGLYERMKSSPVWFAKITKFIYRKCATEAFVLSDYGKIDAIAAGFDEIHILPNAYEDIAGSTLTRSKGSEVSILNVGHLCQDKGTPYLIEAFGKIANSYPEVKLNLVGEVLAPYSEEQMYADIKKSGAANQISWKGVLKGEALNLAYEESDLFIFSSLAPYESFGMVLIEAMHWSLPVIVTDWRANVSVCGEGFGGLVVSEPEKNFSGKLEWAIKSAIEQQSMWVEWGEKNRQIYIEKYTVRKLVDNLRELIL